jgi:hypothetical protein
MYTVLAHISTIRSTEPHQFYAYSFYLVITARALRQIQQLCIFVRTL